MALMLGLNTVRRKLTALVGLSGLASIVSLFVLAWSMHNQIIDEVDDRVPESEHGLEIELDDDLRDLKASVALLATLAKRYRLDLVPGHPVVPEPLITLRPKHGIKMLVRRR